KPDAVTLNQLRAAATGEAAEWVMDRKQRRAIPHRLERCGYTSVNNDAADDGLWHVSGSRQCIYAKNALPGAVRRTITRLRQVIGRRRPRSITRGGRMRPRQRAPKP